MEIAIIHFECHITRRILMSRRILQFRYSIMEDHTTQSQIGYQAINKEEPCQDFDQHVKISLKHIHSNYIEATH
jgi:hypothetical protein